MLKTVVASLKKLYGYSNSTIAARSDVSEKTVARILSGELEYPNMLVLKGLSNCFGVPIDSLAEQRSDRLIRAEEFEQIMLYRSLAPEYKKRVDNFLFSIAAEWKEALRNSYNLTMREKCHELIDRLPLTELLDIKNEIIEQHPTLADNITDK